MRPRYLEIEGLQSFKEVQKIDFDHLSETGLFGIFGPTGSGKSTVLDAITLALYGKVHRVNGTQGIINTNLNTLKVSFTFDILKGSIRKTYRVERVYNRKKSSENSCDVKVARLIEVLESGEVPLEDKNSAVSAKVEELLGLKHDDFTRAVVLPQNKFQEFLLMNNSDKSKMLERIFYLEEYGKLLNDKVAKKLSVTSYSLTNVQGALSQLGDASDKALDEEEKNMGIEEDNKEKVIKELKELESKYNETKEVWQLTVEFDLVTQKEQLHFVLLNEIKAKKRHLDKAIQAESLVDIIKKYKETEKILGDTNEQLSAVLIKFPEQQKELVCAKSEYEAILKEAEETPRLVEKKTRLSTALDMKKEIEEIDSKLLIMRESFLKNKDNISQKDKMIEKENSEAKSIEESIVAYKAQVNALKVEVDYRSDIHKGVKLEDELKSVKLIMDTHMASFNQLFTRVGELQKTLLITSEQVQFSKNSLDQLLSEKTKHEKAKPGSREELTTEIQHYHNLKALFTLLESKQNIICTLKSKVSLSKEGLEKLHVSLEGAEKAKNNCEAEKQACLLTVEHFKKLIEKNTSYILARSLNEGVPCPVCGSSDHPNPATELAQEELTGIEEKFEKAGTTLKKAETALRQAENSCITILEQIKNLNEQFMTFSKEFEDGEKEYVTLTEGIPKEFKELSLVQFEKEIEGIRCNTENKSKAIGEWETLLQSIQNNCSKANEKVTLLMVEEKGIRSELGANIENLKHMEVLLNEAKENYSNLNNRLTEFLIKNKIQGAAAEAKRIAENDEQVERLQKEIEKQQKTAEESRKSVEVLLNEKQHFLSIQTVVETDGKHLKAQKEEKERKVKELAGEEDILSQIKSIEEKLNLLGQREKATADNVKRIEIIFNDLHMQKNMLENQKDIYTKSLESEKVSIESAIKEKGFTNSQEVEKSFLSKEQQRLIKKEVEDYEQVERNLQAQKNIALKKLNNRCVTEALWNEINNLYMLKLTEKEDSISRYQVAKSKYATTKERHESWLALSKSCYDLGKKVDMLEQIKSLLRGNSFIEYVAEERLRYIAKVASEQLGIMTKYRYTLELNSDNGFIICDYANGGARRMVSSLSGGETFLTSLSLALALSKQIQLKGQSPLEFFFLDEGFGTLDNNLLDTVIDSLEKLSSKDRVIGLISHVPELRNRISRRLVINPPTADGAGSSICIEKA